MSPWCPISPSRSCPTTPPFPPLWLGPLSAQPRPCWAAAAAVSLSFVWGRVNLKFPPRTWRWGGELSICGGAILALVRCQGYTCGYHHDLTSLQSLRSAYPHIYLPVTVVEKFLAISNVTVSLRLCPLNFPPQPLPVHVHSCPLPFLCPLVTNSSESVGQGWAYR